MKNTTPPLVRLVDDDLTVAASLTFVLEVAGLQVRHYESAVQFLAYDDPEREGCVLLDVRMPEMTGLELQTELNARASDLPVVFLSAHGNIEMAMSCVKAGAFDFLVKPPHPEKLVDVLRSACAKHAHRRAVRRAWRENDAEWSRLSPAESETALLVAKGLSNREVAQVLGLTEETVKTRRGALFAKLGVHNAAELATFLSERERLSDEIHRERLARSDMENVS